jgi:hypothetical protein
MTDTTASKPTPEPQDQAYSSHGNRTPDHDLAIPAQDWEVVNLPGQIAIEEALVETNQSQELADHLPTQTEPSLQTNDLSVVSNGISSTEELVQLIQDLNQCNDALLLRVSDLEESLERSQAALQAEVERNQGQNGSSAHGASGQGSPGAVPQQIAQLLTELDIANDGLRRTTIHNATLQTELDVNQQRVAQLERECTLLQQRFSEKSTALHQAEESCRDLKARLHRQQRYTLQFKTALEKCLNMTADQSSAPSAMSAASWGGEQAQPVAMPKAQQIQPWSAVANPDQIPAHLTQLLHNLKAPGHGPQPSPSASAGVMPSQGTPSQGNRAAELATPPPATHFPLTAPASSPVTDSAWPPLESPAEHPTTHDPVVPVASTEQALADGLQQDFWHAEPTPTPQTPVPQTQTPEPEASSGFTEPSPWGAPLPQPVAVPVDPTPQTQQATAPVASPEPKESSRQPVQAPLPQTAVGLPTYLQDSLKASPSPVVYPLRSQKKITSLASVQLPSFGRNPRRS